MYVKNVGPGASGPFTVDIYGSCPQETFSDAPHDSPGLAVGAEMFIRITFTFENTGACSVSADVDYDNQVPETNEDNNHVSVNITSQ